MNNVPPTINAYLVFKGFTGAFENVTRAMSMLPTTANHAGGLTKAGRKSKASFWSIKLFTGESWSVGDVLDEILDDGMILKLQRGRASVDGEAWIGISLSVGKRPSIYIPSRLLLLLGGLSIDLDIDVGDQQTEYL